MKESKYPYLHLLQEMFVIGKFTPTELTQIGTVIELVRSYDPLVGALTCSMASLTVREQQVLRMRFGLESGMPMTYQAVGDAQQVTRERIRQIEAKALRKLRHPARASRLYPFVPFLGALDRFDARIRELESLYHSLQQTREEPQIAEKELPPIAPDLLDIPLPIYVLNLSPRATGALLRADIATISALAACTEAQLLEVRNFGKTSLAETHDALIAFSGVVKESVQTVLEHRYA